MLVEWHPLFIHFPIALFSSAVLFDFISILFNKTELLIVSWWVMLLGFVSGVFAIITGFIDWWTSQNSKKELPDLFESDNPSKLITWLKKQNQKTVLLASGDPLWFGIGRVLLDHFPPNQLIFHP